jgi:hypothetical protein
MFFRPALLNL